MEVKIDIDTKKLQKGLRLSERKMQYLHRRATKDTARNLRTQISKDSLGISDLRRKKVIRARVRTVIRGVGVWVGLNDISASEFRGKKQESNGGVHFRGVFFKDAFTGRYRRDPKSATRIFRKSGRGRLEILIPIEADAQKYLEAMIQPLVPKLFDKNFARAVDALPHIWNSERPKKWKKR